MRLKLPTLAFLRLPAWHQRHGPKLKVQTSFWEMPRGTAGIQGTMWLRAAQIEAGTDLQSLDLAIPVPKQLSRRGCACSVPLVIAR